MEAVNGGNGSAIVVASPSAIQEENVSTLMRRATDVAGVCGQIVKTTAVNIQGRKFVRCEGWQSIAVAYGCVASARDVEKIEGGIRAIGEVRRMSDGAVIATAEGFCGDDEKTWQGRPEYAKRAMAQTRAISRVCRSAFAFVVTIIDSSLSTTPYEEADFMTEGSETPPPPTGAAGVKAQLKGPSPSPPKHGEPPPGTPLAKAGHDRERQFRFGNTKGKPLRLLEEGDLKFYERALNNDLTNPEKQQYANSNRAALADVVAELKFRGVS